MRACALAATVLLLAACGGSHPPSEKATGAQVLTLARVLDANREHGGARFTAQLQVHGRAAVADGRVDFRSGRGTAPVRPVDARLGPPRRYFWTRRAVLVQTAPGGSSYARRAPDMQGDPVHAMIAFVNLLAAETVDNTANLTDQGVRFVRHAAVGDEYAFGRETTLWVTGDGLLRRVRTARVPGGLTVDLTTHEPITISLP